GWEYNVSIHALRGEGDAGSFVPRHSATLFQSTPSVGRATRRTISSGYHACRFNPRPPWGGRPGILQHLNLIYHVSIHALRGEGDLTMQGWLLRLTMFQSTPSVGR